jgi:hypothetical protein
MPPALRGTSLSYLAQPQFGMAGINAKENRPNSVRAACGVRSERKLYVSASSTLYLTCLYLCKRSL